MKTLLVAIDFSKASLNAANYAADMAVAIKAKLEILHVLKMPVATDNPAFFTEINEEIYEQNESRLQRLKARLEKRTAQKISVTYDVMEGGVNRTIIDVSEDKKPFAIVLGLKQINSLQASLFGTAALHTAKHAAFPVLLIPEKAKFYGVTKVALATDFIFENSPGVFKDLRRWLDLFNASMDVVHITDSFGLRNEVSKQFELFKRHFPDYKITLNHIVSESLANGIATYLQTKKPTLLTLVYHKNSFLHKMAFRSELRNILSIHTVPFLVFQN